MSREFDRLGRRPTGYGAGVTRPRTSSPGAPTIASGVVFAFSVNAVTATGVLSVRSVGAVELVERRRDVGAERHGELDLARVDLEPAAARVLAHAVDLERRRAGAGGDELAAQSRG